MPAVEMDASFAKKAAKLMSKHPERVHRIRDTFARLERDPFDPALRSKKYDRQLNIWQSYVEAGTPSAWRIWWQWHPTRPDTIVVLAFGPHP